MPQIIPERIDFERGVFGLDFIRSNGVYFAEVHSNKIGNSPTCLYSEANKIYTLRDGEVEGENVQAEYTIYELDLRDADFSIEKLRDKINLEQLIESKKDEITATKLKAGEIYYIPKGVLHQLRGKGILGISVLSGYEAEKMIESDEVNLL